MRVQTEPSNPLQKPRPTKVPKTSQNNWGPDDAETTHAERPRSARSAVCALRSRQRHFGWVAGTLAVPHTTTPYYRLWLQRTYLLWDFAQGPSNKENIDRLGSAVQRMSARLELVRVRLRSEGKARSYKAVKGGCISALFLTKWIKDVGTS